VVIWLVVGGCIVAALVMILGVVLLLVKFDSPLGYEDRTGFHRGEQPTDELYMQRLKRALRR
jgi:hypothetical protein